MRARSLLVAFAVLLGASAARAADAPPPAPPPAPAASPAAGAAEETPRARADRVRSTLPLPGSLPAEVLFSARLLLDGFEEGKASYKAAAGGSPEAPEWDVSERSVVEGRIGGRMVTATTATLDPSLRLLEYERTSGLEGADATERVHAVRTPEGKLRVDRRAADGTETTSTVDADASLTGSFSGLLLLARALPAAPAVYEVPAFHLESGSEKAMTLTVVGAATLHTAGGSRATYLVEARVAEQTLSVHLDPKDRLPVAVIREDARATVWFAAEGVGPAIPAYEPIDLGKPAGSAREAGQRLAYGLVTGKAEYVEAAIHWPSFHAQARQYEQVPDDEAAFKAGFLMTFVRPPARELPPQEALARVMGASAKATEEDRDGVTWVQFGGPLPTLGYGARIVDGAWLVVAFGRRP